MAADEVLLLNLFDSIWFGQEMVTTNTKPEPEPESEPMDNQDNQDTPFSPPVSLTIRSLSDHHLMTDPKSSFFSSSSDSLSPSSVLPAPKLQTIFSGKEVKDYSAHDVHQEEEVITTKEVDQEEVLPVNHKKKVNERSSRRRRYSRSKGTTSSRSLSELEFEELKGFMDLGFVFTEEECKDSKLVSMIPGLQRFCKRSEEREKDVDDQEKKIQSDSGGVSRPYLSEAWDVLDMEFQRKSKKEMSNNKPPLMNWKIPTLVTDVDMKDQLRFWAHTVASTVR